MDEQEGLEARLTRLGEAPSPPEGSADASIQAGELLKLEQLPRELAVLLIEKVEVGERNPETGEQPVQITWKF